MYDDYEYDNGVDLKNLIKESIGETLQETQQKQQQAELEKVTQEVLSESNLTQEDVQKFINDNPEMAKKMFIQNLRDNAQTIARRRDPKTGKFVKGKVSQEPQHQETAPDTFWQTSKGTKPASVMGMGRRHEDNRSFQEKWKKGENRTGTDDEVLDMLTDMIGGKDPAFKTTHQLRFPKK